MRFLTDYSIYLTHSFHGSSTSPLFTEPDQWPLDALEPGSRAETLLTAEMLATSVSQVIDGVTQVSAADFNALLANNVTNSEPTHIRYSMEFVGHRQPV